MERGIFRSIPEILQPAKADFRMITLLSHPEFRPAYLQTGSSG
ncbi:MAG: hypothetical protein WB996_13580 [Ignavibacteriaceae bacterium]